MWGFPVKGEIVQNFGGKMQKFCEKKYRIKIINYDIISIFAKFALFSHFFTFAKECEISRTNKRTFPHFFAKISFAGIPNIMLNVKYSRFCSDIV